MASNVKVTINQKAADEIRNSKEVQRELLRRAKRIQRQVKTFGKGKFVADVEPGQKRAHAMVKTMDVQAERTNAQTNALLKSLGAGM